jgi:hypothetical protein
MYQQNELNIYESTQLQKIKDFKNEAPSVISQGIGTVLKPLTYLTEKMIPEAAIKGALDFSNSAAKWLTDINDIKRDAKVTNIEELRYADLELCDKLADEVHNWAIGIASAEGGVAGAFGIAGMAADFPAIITLALRTIHKIGICYGYESKTELDNQFVLGILSASGANSVKEKEMALLTLKNIETILIKQSWKTMAKKAAEQQLSKEGIVIAIKNLAKQLGINLTKRKALQAIPIIGAGIGATVNGWYIKEIGWAARRIFQERWLIENGKIIEIEY